MADLLLRRGVEIALALVFVVLLLKSLKSSGKAALRVHAPTDRVEDELDPELLARARVEELLKSDPDRVGDILSSWARDEQLTGTGS